MSRYLPLKEKIIDGALGRNGVMQVHGYSILDVNDGINIIPINSQGLGRCWMVIPYKDLNNFIKTLRLVQKDWKGKRD